MNRGNSTPSSEPEPGAEPEPEHHRVVIVGSGFSGLGMAIRLRREGIEDFVVLEKGSDVGGTWRDNTYPGCACDVPSHLYSFSFEPNPDWSRTFSAQPEIWDYLRRCAERHGINAHLRLDEEVLAAAWDEERALWAIDTARGTMTADVLVAGTGGLSSPSIPALPGLENFEGTVFHSATWDHDHDLSGERVAVIGTGASAIQFVPRIQPLVQRLHLFQRTPPWIMPRRDRRVTRLERFVYRHVPQVQLAMRAAIYWARETFAFGFMHPRVLRAQSQIARAHLKRQVADPALRARLTPSYTMGCKRVLISNDYYPALTRPNCEVVSDGIREIRRNSILAADGTEREVDTIIFGTGFQINDQPLASLVRGRDGLTLAEHWHGSMSAYRGTTVSGYPNMFILVGPNTGLGHNSIVFMIESQINYVMDALRTMERGAVATVEPRPEAQAAFNAHIDERMRGTVWTSGGCESWYIDASGRNSTLWPGFTWPFREMTRSFDASEYILEKRADARERAAVA
jgi:cation diffusion facilitator CzcD-associated flavoprotein CzcO